MCPSVEMFHAKWDAPVTNNLKKMFGRLFATHTDRAQVRIHARPGNDAKVVQR